MGFIPLHRLYLRIFTLKVASGGSIAAAVVLENFTATVSAPETHAEYTPPSVATIFGTPKLTASPSTAPAATSKIIWLPPAAVEPKFKLAALEIALTKVPDNGKVTFVAPLDVKVIA